MARKGFIHIIEVIVITLVVFVLVFQFSTLPTIQTDWQAHELKLQAYDILSLLDAKGIDWLSPADVSRNMDSILNGTNVKYELRISNAVKNNISVGCICTPEEYSLFLPSVNPVQFNSRTVTFQSERIDSSSPSYSLRHDVIYIGTSAWNSGKIENTSSLLLSYISSGKGILLSANLSRNSDLLATLFGIRSVTVSPSSLPFVFSEYGSPRLASAVARYFTKIPYAYGRYFSSIHEFESFSPVNSIDADVKNIILVQKSTGYPGAIVRERIVSGKGRAAWLTVSIQPSEDIQHLVRSLILYLSANEFRAAGNDVLRPVKATILRDLRKSGSMLEPVEISLYLSYTF